MFFPPDTNVKRRRLHTDAPLFIYAVITILKELFRSNIIIYGTYKSTIISKLIILPNVIGAKLTPFIYECVCVCKCKRALRTNTHTNSRDLSFNRT